MKFKRVTHSTISYLHCAKGGLSLNIQLLIVVKYKKRILLTKYTNDINNLFWVYKS